MNSKKMKQLREALAERLDADGIVYLTDRAYNKLMYKTDKATNANKIWKKKLKDATRRYSHSSSFLKDMVGAEWRGDI